MKTNITAEKLHELLSYDSTTGKFTWLVNRNGSIKVGMIAGSIDSHGYTQIKIDGTLHSAHRLAWLYVHGTWPKDQIDHINGNPDDNRIENLREANRLQNAGNRKVNGDNKSGFKGVSWHAKNRKWRAQIGFRGKYISLGLHKTAEAASAAYKAKASELFGEFQRA